MKKKMILIGGGGHCKACVDVIQAQDKFRIAGIVDKKEMLHQKISGYEVIACDQDLPKLLEDYENFFIAIGQIKNADIRKEKFEYLKSRGAKFLVIISPLAYVADSAVIDEGTIVMHKAIVNVQAKIGNNCIINTGAIIEHDANIGNHSHISTAAVVNGECLVGSKVFIGSNAVIANNISITDGVIVGAGSVVIENIIDAGTYVGNPARMVNGESLVVKRES